MAYENSNAALPSRAVHPMAKPGYGKRSAPDQLPSGADDFAHLPARAAYLASFIDRLGENAAMDAKTLAKAQPLYGQQAVRSALNELGEAGHLRRVRRRVAPDDGAATGTRWVFHTYWSRTARDDEWWARLLGGDTSGVTPEVTPEVPHSAPAEEAPAPTPAPRGEAHPSLAYDTLARLGLHDPRLALSSADCTVLEGPAAQWLERGVTPERLTQVLVAGLPEQVRSPRGFVQRRLIEKLPPEPPFPTAPPAAPCTLMECTDYRVPGRPEALPGGLCRACRSTGGTTSPEQPNQMQPAAVHARAAEVRASMRAHSQFVQIH